jgi:hypothetical protein
MNKGINNISTPEKKNSKNTLRNRVITGALLTTL